MRDRRRTTAAVLAGGVLLASAGFAIGSQSGGGSAVAREGTAQSRPAHFGGGPGHRGGPGFAALADELGVSEERLRQALEDLRPTGDPGEELAAALSASLGVDRAKVDEALQQLRSAHERRHERKRGDRRRGPRGPRAGGPRHRGHRGGPHGPIVDDLAEALGVDAAKVEQALEDFHAAKHDAFARKLADELGIDVDKVKEALPPRP